MPNSGPAFGVNRTLLFTRSHPSAGNAPPVLVAFGDYDAMRLWQFAAECGGALVEGWKLFGAASLFSEAAE